MPDQTTAAGGRDDLPVLVTTPEAAILAGVEEAAVEDGDDDVWLPVRAAGDWARVDRRSVYMWIKRYGLRHRRDERGRMLVNLPDVVRAELRTRPERDRVLARRERV